MIYKIRLTEEQTNIRMEDIHLEAGDIFEALAKARAYSKNRWDEGRMRVSQIVETDIELVEP